ncbi:MAG: hypothetical protein KDA71_01200, partial [Planctomycetales bacterium]|nr:hypothetical protein [Planctomycetales bacterium]
ISRRCEIESASKHLDAKGAIRPLIEPKERAYRTLIGLVIERLAEETGSPPVHQQNDIASSL